MKKSILLFFTLLFTLSTFSQITGDGPYGQLIIRGVTLINGVGAPPIGPVDIVVEQYSSKEIKVVRYPGVPIDNSKRPQLKLNSS